MNGEPAVHCIECGEEVQVGQRVVPVVTFDGEADLTKALPIHLYCLATQQELRDGVSRAVTRAGAEASFYRAGL